METNEIEATDDELRDIPTAVRAQVLERQAQMWRNTLYDAKMSVKVAKVIEDKPMEQQNTEQVKRCLKAIEFLQSEIATLHADADLGL